MNVESETSWVCLVLSLPTANSALRQRCWRALKAAGAEALRDGVYVLPDEENARDLFESLAQDIQLAAGQAWVMALGGLNNEAEQDFAALFDRAVDYANLLNSVDALQLNLTARAGALAHTEALKEVRKLRQKWIDLVAIDFFPTPIKDQVEQRLLDAESTVAQMISPDEPRTSIAPIALLNLSDFQNKLWVTRARPWVDRLACAWLISRFIDKSPRFAWLGAKPKAPKAAVGYDFDGAMFTHVGMRVTFEVMIISFSLESPSLKRLAQVIHCIDIGGVPVPQAVGVESILSGICANVADDDALLETVFPIFDGLLASFETNQQDIA